MSRSRILLAAGTVATALTAVAITATAGHALGGPDAGTAIVAAPGGTGYAIVSGTGGQYNYGSSVFTGSMAGQPLAAPMVDAATRPGSGGLWMAGADGGVFAFGAPFYGSMGNKPLSKPIVAIVPTASGNGYTLVGADGGTFNFGDAPYPGSLAGTKLAAPIVDAVRPAGGGLLLAAADGGVFALGGAQFQGSMGGTALARPVTAIVDSPSGKGYLLVGQDGGTFAFGDFPFPGSLAGKRLNAPVVDAVRGIDTGVWMLGSDGGVFAMSAPFYGSAVTQANTPPAPAVGSTVVTGALAKATCPAGGSITVSVTIGDQVARMLAAARAGGTSLCGSGWRSVDGQIALRKQNCGQPPTNDTIYNKSPSACKPPTARPGTSMHEKGLAIDFTNCNRGSACFTWLSGNAATYGLHNLPGEDWHWSTTGR
ncbi:M15 family metallopeptidase [Actinoplanes bogorensis]|uniref:M15 family metallopeptidase n=1 Tax=Paractinoplanes bogorensis TaxID=1610840 RepID=A0ABS5YQY3_9ACTN|nr:M15 family metallopeptidase [Actinoplanes bogorensis]MBU2665852.1 M15 family metallopeptidase [Actinoplanes bogorensis]